jgi:hypothetical protein
MLNEITEVWSQQLIEASKELCIPPELNSEDIIPWLVGEIKELRNIVKRQQQPFNAKKDDAVFGYDYEMYGD